MATDRRPRYELRRPWHQPRGDRWWWLTRSVSAGAPVMVDGLPRHGPSARLPFGWRVYGRHLHRNTHVVGPTWFFPFWWGWRHRWALVAWAVDRHWLYVDREGGYYHTARPAWWHRLRGTLWFDQSRKGT